MKSSFPDLTHPLLHPASISEYYNGKLANFCNSFFLKDILRRIKYTVKFFETETKSQITSIKESES